MPTRKVAFIPTQSLFQIEEKIHDRLDDRIEAIYARHKWVETSTTETLKEYLSLTTAPASRSLVLSYDRDKCNLPFSLPNIVEECHDLGAYDLFISQLVFIFSAHREISSGLTHVYFNNVAPTLGSEIDELVRKSRIRYLRKQGHDLRELKPPRILEFTVARNHEGHPLDSFFTYSDKFIQWLAKETCGLVGATPQTEHRRTYFKDHGYEFFDSCWKEEVSDIE